MDKHSFANDFVKGYCDLIKKEWGHDQIKTFNKNLKTYSHIVVFPFSDDDPEKLQLLVGFTNKFEIHQFNDENSMKAAMSQIQAGNQFVTVSKDYSLTETVAFETSQIEPIPLRKIEWAELINAPTLSEDSFSILEDSFLEYFHLDAYAYQEGSNESFDFGGYFNNDKNKPEGLELREVWHDTCNDDKFGSVQSLVFWQGEFIGWISFGGRYLTSSSASTVKLEKWVELMQLIYDQSGFKPGRNINGLSVYDMTKDEVDDVAYVPGVSTQNYDD